MIPMTTINERISLEREALNRIDRVDISWAVL